MQTVPVPTDNLQITLFLAGVGVTVAVCAITIAGWKHKLLIWGLLAVALLFLVLAVTWPLLPAVGRVMQAAVSAGALPFLAVLVGLAAIILVHLKAKGLRAASYDDTGLRQRLEAVEQGLVSLDDFEARFAAFDSNNTAILRHYNKMQDVPDRLTKLEEAFRTYVKGELDRLQPIITSVGEALDAGLIAQAKVATLEQINGTSQAEVAKSLLAVEAQVSLAETYTRQQVIALYQALTAIGHLERARELATEVEEIGNRLATPTTQNAEFNSFEWDDWEELESAWDEKLRAWCDLVSAYRKEIRNRVLIVLERSLKQSGEAKPTQFPTAEAYIAYKAFAIRRVQFASSRLEAEQAIMEVAFNGGGVTERPIK